MNWRNSFQKKLKYYVKLFYIVYKVLMLNALFSFIYKTIAIGSTAVIGISIAFYIGGIVTESMIKKSNEDDEESYLEMDEIIFEEKYDDEFSSLEVKEALPKEVVEKFVSTVETPIGDVVMKYDLDAETFHLSLIHI